MHPGGGTVNGRGSALANAAGLPSIFGKQHIYEFRNTGAHLQMHRAAVSPWGRSPARVTGARPLMNSIAFRCVRASGRGDGVNLGTRNIFPVSLIG